MSTLPDADRLATAVVEAARIRAEIDAARLELAGLRKQVAAARIELVSGRAAHLVEANEHLVLAALASQREADGLTAVQPNPQLQEANTQLLLAAVNAQELRDAAEQALRRQTDFLGLLAHELRSPLAPIRNAAAILGRIPTERPLLGKVQGVIERQVKSMTRLVEDLLDVSRVNSGKLRMEMGTVDMNALIDDVVQASRPSMDTRLQQFDVQLAPGALHVHGDPVRLAQVLGNLLDNASKYTPERGKIRLEAAVEGDRMLLVVSDTGIGITAQALPTIFDPFVQERHATLFNGTGLGIGLTVVRELVEGHGGEVTVVSAGQGLGSCFSVSLPLLRPG